jgi:hypothetical protein
MDSMDHFRERIEALEQQMQVMGAHTRSVERRLCWRRFPGSMVVAALGLALALSHGAQAKTFRCGAGDVSCLIDAINTANANGQTNMIRLAAGTYTLTEVDNTTDGPNGLPSITSPLTITGAGAATTSIERSATASAFRLLHVAATGRLTLKRLTLRGGNASFEGGGALANVGGTVTVTHSTIADNRARDAGGIDNVGGALVITHSTLARNHAIGGAGGGISNVGGGTLTITASALVGNTAQIEGGGIWSLAGTVTVTNSTLAGNIVANACSAIVNGGTMILTNSTIAGNTVGFDFGALCAFGTVTMQNTLLAANTNGVFGGDRGTDCLGVVTSVGHNLIGDPRDCTITLQPSDLTGDPGLGPFTDNGRPGNGHFPLLPTSQAIDAGNKAGCPRRDQLGRLRLGPCDIGAIEFRHRDDRQPAEEDDKHNADLAAAAQASQ